MSPSLALVICWVVVFWVFYKDHRQRPNCSRALWIPVVWLALLGSHPLSFWLGVSSSGDDLEGSPLDRIVYTAMILVSCWIVLRRGLAVSSLIGANKAMFLFYLFLGATILWADFPFTLLKRWVKEIGAIFIGLIILTENDPLEAIEAVFLRCAYVLLPLSVVFVKYVPALGRIFSHTGDPQYVGVTVQKNSLGEVVLVFCTVIIWSMLRHYERRRHPTLKEFAWPLLVLLMGLWLLHMSDSRTSMLCLGAAAIILLSHRLPFLKTSPRLSLFVFLGALPFIILLKSMPGISDAILQMLGRNPTLTNRTEIWEVVKAHPVNPLVGCGYLMYWDVNKSVQVGDYDVSLKTIHNGYLEIYLDGGYIGVAILACMLFVLAIRAGRAYLSGSDYGRLFLTFFIVTLLFNLSESIFARRGPLWFSFLLFCIGGSSIFADRLDRPQVESDDAPDESLEYFPA